MSDTLKREIGGNTLSLWRAKINTRISNYFSRRSDRLTKRGNKTIITNPSCKFINHCTIIFNFTVDNNEKFQLIHEGIFSDKYKAWRKREEEHKLRLDEWRSSVSEWELSDNETRGGAPVKPEFDENPIPIDEMFATIIHYHRSWYRKDLK